MVIGKLDKKIVFSKNNESGLRWQYGYRANNIKYGDNVYIVAHFANGNPYSTYNTLMDRNEIVDYINRGHTILGLKLDKVGRLIEDPNAENPDSKIISKIKDIVLCDASNGRFYSKLTMDKDEYSEAQKLAAKIVGDDDPWEVHGLVKQIAGDLAEKHNLYIGSVFVTDECEYTYVARNCNKIIPTIAWECKDIIFSQHYDKDSVEGELRLALNERETYEPWLISGSFDADNIYEAALALEPICDQYSDSTYGEYGMWVNEPMERAIKALAQKAKSDLLAYELKILMKNIKVFRRCEFKANNPQETFKRYIKAAMLGQTTSTDNISDYIDLTLAVQEIYYKNPENIRCDKEGTIVIGKAGIKIERKPYVLTVSKI